MSDAGHWIKDAVKHPGALRAKAKAAGESTGDFAREHQHDSGATGRQARLAITLGKMHGHKSPKTRLGRTG